jgi:hypothetical protein
MIPLVLKIKELKHQNDTKSRISESRIPLVLKIKELKHQRIFLRKISDIGGKEINEGKNIELYIYVAS